MKKTFWFAVFLIGFSSMLAQITVLREALAGFFGNELVLGIVLGNWLFITGAGTYLGRRSGALKNKINVFALSQILVALFTPPTVFLVKVSRTYFTTPGETVSFLQVIVYSLIILTPFCLTSGFRFSLAASIACEKRKQKAFQAANVYVADAAGNLAGGFSASFILIPLANSFQTTYLVSFLCLTSALLLSKESGNKQLTGLSLLALLVLAALASAADLEGYSTRLQFRGQDVLQAEDTLYGKLVVTSTGGQINFYENGFPMFSTGNEQSSEEKVHYAMLEHPEPDSVLLVSGGVSGTVEEVLEYEPSRIDYVELDPAVIGLGREYTQNLEDERVGVHNVDGRLYVRETSEKYDVVIVDLPGPDSIQVNRFYTVEFLREVKSILNPSGIVSLHLSAGENYLSEEAEELNSVVYNTLASVFRNVLVVPGSTNYYVASDSNLSYDYARLVRERRIETEYFENYLGGVLTEDRMAYAQEALKDGSRLNTDFKPASHQHYLLYWLSLFKTGYVALVALAVAASLTGVFISRLKPVPFTILVTGFSAMALEFCLIVSFQVLYGFVYRRIGLIVTAFMLGSVTGAYVANKKFEGGSARTLARFDYALFAYSLSLPAALSVVSGLSNPGSVAFLAEIIIPSLTFGVGVLAGVEYPIALKVYSKKTGKTTEAAGELASLDLFGACAGAIALSVLLVPLWGVMKVMVAVGFMNLASGLYVWLRSG